MSHSSGNTAMQCAECKSPQLCERLGRYCELDEQTQALARLAIHLISLRQERDDPKEQQ